MATASPELQEQPTVSPIHELPSPEERDFPPEAERRPFLAHLEELRRRLIRCFLWAGLGTAAGWFLAPELLSALIRPVGQVVYLSPVEPFLTQLKAAFLAGIAFSSPLLAWELWGFLRPALPPTQRWQVLAAVPVSGGLFLLGGWLGWRFLLPAALTILRGFGSAQMTPMLTVGHYVGFAGWLIVGCGLAFQLPVAVWLLARAGVIRPGTLARQWRVAVVAILVAAAVLTPTPDVASQLLLASVLAALYVVSVGVACIGSGKLVKR